MQMHQIRYFLVLAEERNFTRAAKACGISQPSLTNAITALHIGLRPSLVDEDQAFRRDPTLIFGPLSSPSRDVGTVAFASHHAFF